MLDVFPIAAFSDNYIWCPHRDGDAVVVDPGDAAPVLAALEQRQLRLKAILITHHHMDHIGGLADLLRHRAVPVFGPHNPAIYHITRRLQSGDSFELLGERVDVLAVPGHTLDHLAFYIAGSESQHLLFCGDTLFAGGCGRLFEGTPAMMHASLSRLAALPAETLVYCAHEYTLANLRFAKAVDPHNPALNERIAREELKRVRGEATLPSSIALECATNPFLRSAQPALMASAQHHSGRVIGSDVECFTIIRSWKDSF